MSVLEKLRDAELDQPVVVLVRSRYDKQKAVYLKGRFKGFASDDQDPYYVLISVEEETTVNWGFRLSRYGSPSILPIYDVYLGWTPENIALLEKGETDFVGSLAWDRWVDYQDLSSDSVNALREYWVSFSDDEYFQHVSNFQYQLILHPREEMERFCMLYSDDLWGCDVFEEYHKIYVGDGADIPHHEGSRWPAIAPGDGEWLDDGWHRLHSYYRDGDQFFPVLYLRRRS